MSNTAFAKILAEVEKMKSGGYKDDEADFWKLEGDKAGNGRAVIRFMPAKDDDSAPFVRVYAHGFKNAAGKWYIENCPTTIKKECPCCEANSVLWNSGIEANKEIVRGSQSQPGRKRKVSYIANILVVEDPSNPDNNGKVFKFKFGQSIFDKIVDAMKPPFDDQKPINPFDALTGADFNLRMRRVDGYANFDSSTFNASSELGSAKVIAELIASLHDISKYVAESAFKAYDDLRSRFNMVTGGASQPTANTEPTREARSQAETQPKPQREADPTLDIPMTSTKTVASLDGEDDEEDFFRRLAQ